MKSLTILCLCTAILCNLDASAQSSSPVDNMDLPEWIGAIPVREQQQRQEKLWLHLDKPYYGAGDKIWFRAYLLSAGNHCPDTLSNFVYVDITNRKNEVVLAKKIKRDSLGLFANCFDIPATLPAGEYTLRAYTGWMLNFDPAFFFQRNLCIGNSVADPLTSSMSLRADNGTQQAILRFTGPGDAPCANAAVRYELFAADGKKLHAARQETSAAGSIFVDLPIDSLRQGGYIEASLDDKGKAYTRTFFLPDKSRDYSVQFLPEGGDLIEGTEQRVAFRAEGADGLSLAVSGRILDRAGQTVATFETEHDGMGSFALKAVPGEAYTAETESPDGEKRTFGLPPVRQGFALSAETTASGLVYRVRSSHPIQPDSLLVVACMRGICLFGETVDGMSPSGAIPVEYAAEGILHVMLTDARGNKLSERLVFVSHPELRGEWEIAADKPTYARRDRVSLAIKASDFTGEPLAGDLSVSVTDRKAVRYDPLQDNMLSNLLLCSDLHGQIEHPGYYFNGDSPEIRRHLDLVMMTHGWRRFDTRRLGDTAPFRPEFFIERGQYLSGHVKGIAEQSAPGAGVVAIALNRDNVFGTATADSAGNYLLDIDFADTTTLLVSASTAKGQPVQDVTAAECYPKPKFARKNPFTQTCDDLQATMQDYLDGTKERYTTEQGLKMYRLKGATVQGENFRKPKEMPYGTIYDTASLAKFKPMLLLNYIFTIPGITRYSEQRADHTLQKGEMNAPVSQERGIYIKRKATRDISQFNATQYTTREESDLVTLTLNGRTAKIEELEGYTVADVEYIRVMQNYSPQDKHGIKLLINDNRIDIVLKEGATVGGTNIGIIKMTGYAANAEFYSPVYDTPQKKEASEADARTTLYWNPSLSLDADGTARIVFYNDDSDSPQYEVTIEGITPDGRVCRYQQKL